VTLLFIYHHAIKKFCDGKTQKRPGPALVPAGQKIRFLFSGDSRRFHLSYTRILNRSHLSASQCFCVERLIFKKVDGDGALRNWARANQFGNQKWLIGNALCFHKIG
jgi:hypothetical protein